MGMQETVHVTLRDRRVPTVTSRSHCTTEWVPCASVPREMDTPHRFTQTMPRGVRRPPTGRLTHGWESILIQAHHC